MSFRRLLATAAASVSLSLPVGALAADPPSDSFIAGYAAAVLEREMAIKADGLSVTDGHLEYTGAEMAPELQAQLVKALSAVPGVKDVRIVIAGEPKTTPAAQPIEVIRTTSTPASQSASATPAGGSTSGTPSDKSTNASDSSIKIATDEEPLTLYLGAGRVFSPLLADPRWPHFYASYNQYDQDRGTTHLNATASVGFGETISFLKKTYSNGFRWELGMQAGVFALYDMDTSSKDLINADYFVGPYFAARQGNFSLLARVYHQSSHIGDEYILRSTADPRVNFTFETLNVLLSYDLPAGFRVYGGGGYTFDYEPDEVDPWNVEYGVEWISPTTVFGTNWLRPVAAFDGQNRETTDWDFSYGVRAGFQIEDPTRFTQRLQIMFEYYDGNSTAGQFYDNHVRYYGIGAHFYF